MQNWTNWIWQEKNSIQTIKALEEKINWFKLNTSNSKTKLSIKITPYYLSLIDKKDKNDPLAKIVVPSELELKTNNLELINPIGDAEQNEEINNKATEMLVHRYQDRALILTTDTCASHCRYCFRRSIVCKGKLKNTKKELQKSIGYIKKNPHIKEVILSGGDPLSLSDKKLKEILQKLSKIKHVRLIRIHTRFPVYNPFRVTPNLTKSLKSSKKELWVVLHIAHPREITSELENAIKLFRKADIALLNQTVLAKGINDNLEILKELSYRLAENHIKPYYLHYPDMAIGTSHFRIPLKQAIELHKNLIGHLSGYLVPQLTLDIPKGYGKIPLIHNFISEIKTLNETKFIEVESPLVKDKNGKHKKSFYQEVLTYD
ncbi:MAG: KamA family radical SAM protein [archaeon]|jgi:lysine 2,3-aminomutase